MNSRLVVDNFAGGGGASQGIETALGRPVDFAINHDPEAIAMHRINHPGTRHLMSSVWDVNPAQLCAGREVELGWFSPDCTFHSKARGAKPFRDRDQARRRRGLAWLIPYWMKAVRPRVVCLENVEEFADWGPLLPDGRPDPAKRGLTFRRWHRQIENLGYQVDMRELRADRYGAPTTRKRLFVIARCDGQEIVFPEATHGPERGLQPYRTAAECIDWSIPCPSIFERPRPLAEATMKRIARGIMRYVVNNRQPFIVDGRAPFLTEHANASHQRTFRADEPMRTQCAQVKGGHFAMVAAVIAGCGGRMGQSPERPVSRPMQTLTAKTDSVLVSAFLAKHFGGHEGPGISLAQPIDTITTVDHHALVMAFLTKYYGTGAIGSSLADPLHTVRSTDHYGLVMVHGTPHRIVDIGMRMLTPRELYRAQSFPDDYTITHGLDEAGAVVQLTKTAQVRMCGNSVAPAVAEALVRANVIEQRQEHAA